MIRLRDGTAYREIRLGLWGSPEAEAEYDRLLRILEAHNRHLPAKPSPQLTVTELFALHDQSIAERVPPDQLERSRRAKGVARRLFGTTPAAEFGPLAMATVRSEFIRLGYTRGHVASCTACVSRVWRWAAQQEILPVTYYQALRTLEPLRKKTPGLTQSRVVRPVRDDVFERTLPHFGRVLRDYFRVLRLTPMRPSELANLRPADVSTEGRDHHGMVWPGLWVYVPASHKTEGAYVERMIFFGPRAQAILQPYLARDPESYCFSPREATRERMRFASRRQRQPGEHYSLDAIAHAVRKACKRAKLDHEEYWTAKQVEKAAVNAVRQLAGLDAASAAKDHASLLTTQLYVTAAKEKAAAALREIG